MIKGMLAFLAGCLGWAACAVQAAALPATEWASYKQAFVQEGRIVDTGNQSISHSEGQGYGMLLAIAADDRASFEQIWDWTRKNLQREDTLFGWRWTPNSAPHVQDWNNATDGDLLIAWALARGGERWSRTDWIDEARMIAQGIRGSLIRPTPFGPVIIPGQQGFQSEKKLLINPSYWVFPAFKLLKRIDPDPIWEDLLDSGLALISKSRFGPHQLPPDWVVLYSDQRLGLPEAPNQRRMGYEAIRLPLYLCWADLPDPIMMEGFRKIWPSDQAPDWFDLANGDRSALPLSLSQRAIRHLVAQCSSKNRPSAPLSDLDIQTNDYYGSTLTLLVRFILAHPKNLP
ncbi:MAG: endoglucanase [Halothiobacillaceae bacterium]|nr:MAG: endoglucanase [Halothiobacillaceae bacterium]